MTCRRFEAELHPWRDWLHHLVFHRCNPGQTENFWAYCLSFPVYAVVHGFMPCWYQTQDCMRARQAHHQPTNTPSPMWKFEANIHTCSHTPHWVWGRQNFYHKGLSNREKTKREAQGWSMSKGLSSLPSTAAHQISYIRKPRIIPRLRGARLSHRHSKD